MFVRTQRVAGRGDGERGGTLFVRTHARRGDGRCRAGGTMKAVTKIVMDLLGRLRWKTKVVGRACQFLDGRFLFLHMPPLTHT